jgi:nucleotide-binding universal stress UspA family protein
MIEQQEPHDHRIVVGIDNSTSSAEALRWALAYARLTGGTVEAVSAWQAPATYGWTVTETEAAGLVGHAEKAATETVAHVMGERSQPVVVTTHVTEGPAAQVLLAAGKGAELLVLGSRGHGAFAGMLLGSVSQHCVQHAACPTVIIPERSP